jgi:hypothetical protein
MARAQKITDFFQGAVAQHRRAQQPLLRLEVLRQDAVGGFLLSAGRRSDVSVYHYKG